MAESTVQPRRVSTSNTKQEVLDAYQDLLKQLEEQREAELKPEERIEEKVKSQVVEVADSLSADGVVQAVGTLKGEVGRLLGQLSDRLDEEVGRYRQIKRAVQVKEGELQEIYEIQKAASSLAALIAAQNQKRLEFETEMTSRREELTREIQTARTEWEKEKAAHDAVIRERDTEETRRREREKEEYQYSFKREQQLAREQFQDEKARQEREILFKREQQLAREQFQDEKARQEREILFKREQTERELAEREQAIAQREAELTDLREQVAGFPQRLEAGVSKSVKEAVDRAQLDARGREDLLKKEFQGERNVLNTRIESLENTVKEQNEQIARLAQQAEKASNQVQDIAVKAIEGSSGLRALASLQALPNEPPRRAAPEPER